MKKKEFLSERIKKGKKNRKNTGMDTDTPCFSD